MSDRDAQLRRRLLLQASFREQDHQAGYVPATVFVAQARDDDDLPVDDDAHAERLLTELLNWNLLELARDPHLQAGVKREFRHKRYRLTAKGTALLWADIAPISGVDDPRLDGA